MTDSDVSPSILPSEDNPEVPGPRQQPFAEDKSQHHEKEDEGLEKEEEWKRDPEKPLLEDEGGSVKIDIETDKDTPTLPIADRKRKSRDDDTDATQKPTATLPIYLFPFTRIKDAWNESNNVFQFLGSAVCIIFQTVGWFTCVGGIPFLSLVMLIIGSIYVHDCKIEPNIPVYLIVSGVIGTIQHFLTIWTKYVPKNAEGKLKIYRSYCRVLNGLFHLFLMVWFILGCIWIYSSHSEVDFKDPQKQEYCHRTLYYFAFWITNLSFILLGLLLFLSMCFLVFVIAADK